MEMQYNALPAGNGARSLLSLLGGDQHIRLGRLTSIRLGRCPGHVSVSSSRLSLQTPVVQALDVRLISRVSLKRVW